ncbi:winged helix-turn-helix domain-containing protein [Photobacterium alginatilyticum]|uniref:winged helix-turn-helix domain-containing protein n=1 Tax=Photobacterium alginatilyticum TaxID=1775171 RepID=UPI0040685B5C
MSSREQIKFQTDVYFIPCQGIIKSPDSIQKLNLSEQNILTFLIDNHQRPITKSELLKIGWPDRVVTEASLFQVIRALRVKLQERHKGEVIETLPRVGYQVTQFERQEVPLDTELTKKTKFLFKHPLFPFSFVCFLLIASIGSYFWLNHYKRPAQNNYLTQTEYWGDNSVTLIATNEDDLDDLRQKLNLAYRQHLKLVSPPKITKVKAFAFKGDGIYSVAWCRVDNESACQPNTDFSYTFGYHNWEQFSDLLVHETKTYRDDPVIQTQLAREPTAQVFMNYIDESGIQSKVVHHYISKGESATLNYSYMSFITEKDTDFHHALSVRAATLSIIENESPFLSTAQLKPDMFHWAYQPSDLFVEEKSTALKTESKMRDDFRAKRIAYSYLLYQQPYLDLIFYPNVGIYWIHNSVKSTKLFNYKQYIPEYKQQSAN